MKSVIYDGVVTHRRRATAETGNVANEFQHHISMPFVFLDELDDFIALHPLWSRKPWHPVRFDRSDYLGDPTTPLDEAVRQAVSQRLGRRPSGQIAMLAHWRTWGWLFNPLTLYYCYSTNGNDIDAVVLEVTSTPWRERHVYVVDGKELRTRFAKEMHVSPFLGMGLDYVMTWAPPDERLNFHLSARHGDTHVFDAGMVLTRRPASRSELGRLIRRRPLQTYGVSSHIYAQAARLAWKRAPFHSRALISSPRGGATQIHQEQP
ncbi:MAG: DUF1365 domain-containing protein [Acidimicrobiales bacterium]